MSDNIYFDKNGTPTFAFSSGVAIQTKNTQSPQKASTEIYEKYRQSVTKNEKIELWGNGNNQPQKNNERIKSNVVLKRSLNLLRKVIIAQGIEAVDSNNEPITDKQITDILNSTWVRMYISEAATALLRHGNGFVQLARKKGKNELGKLYVADTKYCRMGKFNKKGEAQKLYYSGYFPQINNNYLKSYYLLDRYNALEQMKDMKNNMPDNVFMHLKDLFSDNTYYADAPWIGTEQWIDISNKNATALSSGLDNMFNATILIRIPWAYWQAEFPEDEYETTAERKQAITERISEIQEKFTSSENAQKTLIQMFGNDENDPEADKWSVEVIDNKTDTTQLQNNNFADTQIAIGAGMHPDLLGMMFGNSKGGSMQREILTLLYALSWEERQQILYPLELFLNFNLGDKMNDIHLKFKQTFLKTLDAGAGTGEVLT